MKITYKGKMIFIKIILIINVILITFISCTINNKNKVNKIAILKDSSLQDKNIMLYLNKYKSFQLQDFYNLDTIKFESKDSLFFTEQTPFALLSNGCYIIASSYPEPFIGLYSKSGSFIKKISRYGNGPGEYQNAGYIDVKNDTIYLFDRERQRVLKYDSSGGYVNSLNITTLPSSSFKISPSKNDFIFYHLLTYPNGPIFSIIDSNGRIIGSFGKSQKINSVSAYYLIQGITLNEKGFIFIIQPQEYGYLIYNIDGKLLKKIDRDIPSYFHSLSPSQVNDINILNRKKVKQLYFTHSRIRDIFYMGNDILLIQIENPMKNKNFPLFLEFWRIDGLFLGVLKSNIKVANAKDGILYFWYQSTEKDKNGFYPNPYIIKCDFFETINKEEY